MRPAPVRVPLPPVRRSVTHKAVIATPQGDCELFITVGLYADGRPGEVFLQVGKLGSTLYGLLEVIGRLLSYLLQYGVPLGELMPKMRGITFQPAGATNNEALPTCTSLVDYLASWMEMTFGGGTVEPERT